MAGFDKLVLVVRERFLNVNVYTFTLNYYYDWDVKA